MAMKKHCWNLVIGKVFGNPSCRDALKIIKFLWRGEGKSGTEIISLLKIEQLQNSVTYSAWAGMSR